MFAYHKKTPPETKKTSPQERRQHKRFPKNFILKYFDLENPREKHEITQLKNISQGGLCFINSKNLAQHARLGIELKTPYISTTTYLEGVILDSHEKIPGILFETRLRFEKLDTQAELILKELIEYFLKGDDKSYD